MTEVKDAFARARSAATTPLSIQNYFNLAYPLVAQIKDSHTCIFAPRKIRRDSFRHDGAAFPLLMTFHEDFAVVNRNREQVEAGTKIIEINNRTIPEIVFGLSDFSCQDGNNVSATLNRMNRNFPLVYQMAYGNHFSFTVAMVTPDGRKISKKLRSMPVNIMNSLYAPPTLLKSFIKTRWKTNEQTYYMKIRSFLVGKDRFARSMERVFKEVREKDVKHLVIDLRGNGGGWVSNASLLLAYLLNRRHYFPHYFHVPSKKLNALATVLPNTKLVKDEQDALKEANHFIGQIKRFGGRKRAYPQGLYALARSQAWGKKSFKGELHVLVDGGTHSAASMMAAQLRLKRKVTFYGDIAGGAPNRNCSSPHHVYVLPHSGFQLQVAWNCNIEKLNRKPGVFKPDFFFVDEAHDSRWKDRLLKLVYKKIAGKWFPPLPLEKPLKLK
ncbi:S41 family peptidase [Alphaproteobacteria bacterium]|nr:S41 family peptidase [Alphaproteobacteria bacterium]